MKAEFVFAIELLFNYFARNVRGVAFFGVIMKSIIVVILTFLLYCGGNAWAVCEKEADTLKVKEGLYQKSQCQGNVRPQHVTGCNELQDQLRNAQVAWEHCNYLANQPSREPKYITACRQFINNWDETTANVLQAYGDCRKKGESHESCYVNLCKVLQKSGGEKTKCMRANGAPGPGVSTQCQVFLPAPPVFFRN